MIRDSSTLKKGQILRVDVNEVKERLQKNILEIVGNDPLVELVGYKMVDGNQFGLVVKLKNDKINWFFEKELSEIMQFIPKQIITYMTKRYILRKQMIDNVYCE